MGTLRSVPPFGFVLGCSDEEYCGGSISGTASCFRSRGGMESLGFVNDPDLELVGGDAASLLSSPSSVRFYSSICLML